MLIRPACSCMTLDESMEKAKEVLTQESLIECLKENFCGDMFNLDTLQCKEYGLDERIGWMTYLLTADFADGTYKQQAVAFANDDIARLPCGPRTPAKD